MIEKIKKENKKKGMNSICPNIIQHFIFVFFLYFFYHFSCLKDQFTVLSLKFIKRESTVNIIPVQKNVLSIALPILEYSHTSSVE